MTSVTQGSLFLLAIIGKHVKCKLFGQVCTATEDVRMLMFIGVKGADILCTY
jgi:hypothetical protein